MKSTPVLHTYVCDHCKASFERPAVRFYKYCSRACTHAGRVGKPRGKYNVPGPQPIRLRFQCGWCGLAFTSKPSAGAKQHFCCRACQGFHLAAKDKRPLNLSVRDAAYLAGIVDGEGTVSVFARKGAAKWNKKSSIRLSVVNTHFPLLEWVVERTGVGSILTNKKIKEGYKPQGVWAASSFAALAVLEQIEPYMLEKRHLAQAALKEHWLGLRPMQRLGQESPTGRQDQWAPHSMAA